MKKVTSVLLIVIFVNAGMFSSFSGMFFKEQKPVAEYTIDTAGINPRAYEFITATKPYHHCIVVFGNSDRFSLPVMQCWKEENQKLIKKIENKRK